MTLTRTAACRKTGLLRQALDKLISMGILIPDTEGLVREEDLSALVKGHHYVVCPECGCKTIQLSQHFPSCCGQSVVEYLKRHPGTQVLSGLSEKSRAKNPIQRKAQSETLKARFQTPAGEITRAQIAEHAKFVMDTGYKAAASAHLRALNALPETRADRSRESKSRWESGTQRMAVEGWHRDHRERSLTGAANARRFIGRKRTKLHLRLKDALMAAGIRSETEFEVGYYAIDEAIPSLRISIEADGCYWHGCAACGFPPRPETFRYDRAKESFLTKRGWSVLHLPGHEIQRDLDRCVEKVRQAIRARQEG